MQVRIIVQISYIFEEHKLFQQNTKSIINTSNKHVTKECFSLTPHVEFNLFWMLPQSSRRWSSGPHPQWAVTEHSSSFIYTLGKDKKLPSLMSLCWVCNWSPSTPSLPQAGNWPHEWRRFRSAPLLHHDRPTQSFPFTTDHKCNLNWKPSGIWGWTIDVCLPHLQKSDSQTPGNVLKPVLSLQQQNLVPTLFQTGNRKTGHVCMW